MAISPSTTSSSPSTSSSSSLTTSSSIADVNLTTPKELPTSPEHWYKVRIPTNSKRLLDVDTSPSANQRRKTVYMWRLKFSDGTHKDYVGKTTQTLMARTYQHLRQAEDSKGGKKKYDFHEYLKQYARCTTDPKIDEIKLGIVHIVPPGESLAKTEQVYISAKKTLTSDGGLNKINANASVRNRLVRKNLKLAFDECAKDHPRQIIVSHDNQ